MIQNGTFREDLYYRLHVVPVDLPPLRAHPNDIPLLAEHFLAKLSERDSTRAKRLTPEALKALMDYSWPGNVRELENALEYAVVTSSDDWIRRPDLPPRISAAGRPGNGALATAIDSTEKDPPAIRPQRRGKYPGSRQASGH